MLFLSVTFAPLKNGLAADVNGILKTSFENVRLVDSIEFTANFEDAVRVNVPDKGVNIARINKGTMRYYQAGDLFRVEIELYDEDGYPQAPLIAAYDGKKYQQFSKKLEILEFKKTPIDNNPSLFCNPLVSVYAWLLGYNVALDHKETLAVFSGVKNFKMWERCFADAKIVGDVEERGNLTTVVDFNNRKVDSQMRVWFAKNLQHFPVTWTVSSSNAEDKCHVEKFLRFESNGHPFYVPTKVTVLNYSPEHRIHSVVSIDEKTLFVNREIDRGFFTIPETWAKTVTDIDTMNPFSNDSVFSNDLIPFSPVRIFLTLTGVILIILGIMLHYYKK